MNVLYPDYFAALGFKTYYNTATGQFDKEGIIDRIKSVQNAWHNKYPHIDMKTQNLKFDNLVNFAFTYTTEMEYLNLDQK
jgi:hypothetical protein